MSMVSSKSMKGPALTLLVSLAVACPLAVWRAVPAGGKEPSRNGRITFSSSGNPHRLLTIRPDGTGLVPVTDKRQFSDSPSWAPGGRWIAYNCSRSDRIGGNICLIRADGTNKRKITTNGTSITPDWSPDGRLIAFCRLSKDENGTFHSRIILMRRDGSHIKKLPDLPGSGARNPAWAPGGNRLVFSAESSTGSGLTIWIVKKDGSDLTELTTDAQGNSDNPSWSPDGSRIVFDRFVDRPGDVIGEDVLFTMKADGTQQRRLTKGPKSRGYAPVWSPNGRKIAFLHARKEGAEPPGLYVINADGTGRERIYFDGTGVGTADWGAR